MDKRPIRRRLEPLDPSSGSAAGANNAFAIHSLQPCGQLRTYVCKAWKLVIFDQHTMPCFLDKIPAWSHPSNMDASTKSPAIPVFDDPLLFDALDALSTEELDEVPFGVVRMNDRREVVGYNRAEANVAGLNPVHVVGRHFFTEVAPCLNNAMVAARYKEDAELDAVLDYVLTYRMRPRKVKLRLLGRASRPWSYFCVWTG